MPGMGLQEAEHSLECLGAILILLRAEGDKICLESDTWTTHSELNTKANSLVCSETIHIPTGKDLVTVWWCVAQLLTEQQSMRQQVHDAGCQECRL